MLDLHTHSTCSDGSERPGRVVELAAAAGCSTVALTDHDTLDGIAEARARAGELGIGFVAGCEVSATHNGVPLHLLCYFFTTPGGFDDFLGGLRAEREVRNMAIADRLATLGVSDALPAARAEAGGAVVGRPHFAAVLVRHGLATSINDAFERYLKQGRPAYAPRSPLAPATVVAAARESGGVVAFAHPLSCQLPEAGLETLAAELAAAGLCGLEAYYAAYSAEERRALVALARRHGLVPTGGSDFHGRIRPESAVGVGSGDLEVPDSVLDELTGRCR